MTIVVSVPDQAAVDLLADLPAGVEVISWDGGDDKPDRLAETEFWVPQVDAPGDLPAMFAQLPELKVVQLTSAGVETVLGSVPDGVTLCDGRGIHGGSVAEMVLALILASQRRLPQYFTAQQHKQWNAVRADELQDKRVLVVGAGDLGEQTARRLRSFDAEPVLVAHSARAGIHATDELPELLPDADIVVLVVPLTKTTTGMVDAKFLSLMPDDALLVNVARGKVVDTDALLAEVQSGRLRAALDVTDPEPLPSDHPLWQVPGVLITPHAAGHVNGAERRAFALVADQIRRYSSGADLINVVDGDY